MTTTQQWQSIEELNRYILKQSGDPTKREYDEEREIDRQKNQDQHTQPKPKSRVSVTPADQHTQLKLKSRLETTPETASRNVNDSTEKEAGYLGKECKERERDEGKGSDNVNSYEEKEGEEEGNEDMVEPHEHHITTDTKQGLGYKRVRKYPITRGKDFLWEIQIKKWEM